MFLAFPKDFFKLTLIFAEKISQHFNIPYSEALYQCTPLYIRLLGSSGKVSEKDEKWRQILKFFPKSLNEQTDYIYNLYEKYESTKKGSLNKHQYGCFSYTYIEASNIFELDFANNDPLGNLKLERITYRTQELRKLTLDIQNQQKSLAIVHVHSWLLSIEAFTRLFPTEFINNKRLWDKNRTRSNTFWGQFVDRKGNLRTDLAQQLINNTKNKYPTVASYFPIKAYFSEVPQEIFFSYYLNN